MSLRKQKVINQKFDILNGLFRVFWEQELPHFLKSICEKSRTSDLIWLQFTKKDYLIH